MIHLLKAEEEAQQIHLLLHRTDRQWAAAGRGAAKEMARRQIRQG